MPYGAKFWREATAWPLGALLVAMITLWGAGVALLSTPSPKINWGYRETYKRGPRGDIEQVEPETKVYGPGLNQALKALTHTPCTMVFWKEGTEYKSLNGVAPDGGCDETTIYYLAFPP